MEVCIEVLEDGEWRQVGELLTERERAREYGPPILQKRRRPVVWRDYDFFGAFGYQRRPGIEAIDQPRGLPSDVTADTATDWKEWGDASMETWFTFDELDDFFADRPAVAEAARRTGFMDVIDAMREYRERSSIDTVRAVIWIAA